MQISNALFNTSSLLLFAGTILTSYHTTAAKIEGVVNRIMHSGVLGGIIGSHIGSLYGVAICYSCDDKDHDCSADITSLTLVGIAIGAVVEVAFRMCY